MPSLTVQHVETQTQHNQDHSGLVEGSGKAYEQADVQGAAMRPCMAHMLASMGHMVLQAGTDMNAGVHGQA
jgi:hypothetical protein